MGLPAGRDWVEVTAQQRREMLKLVARMPALGDTRLMRLAGVAGTRGQLKDWLAANDDLRDAISDARGGQLRRSIIDQALNGSVETTETRDARGRLVSTVTKRSPQPRMTEFAAKMYLPEARELRSGRIEVTGEGGGAVEVTVKHDFEELFRRAQQQGVFPRSDPAGAADADVDVEPARPALLPARTD